MAQSRAESTRDTYNYGQYINQFPPNTIKVIPEFERIQKKICRHKMSIMFNIGLGVRMFANGPGDLGSIPGRVIPKTQKMALDASLHNTQHYKVRIKGKVEQSREGVAPSLTHWCSSYRKGSLRVTLDYGRQLYFTIYIYSGRVND